MKIAELILTMAVLVSGSFASAKELIIDYSYGNQIFGSTLKIYDDGSIEHGERTCCPPHTDRVPESDLNPGKLADLKDWIREAAVGIVISPAGRATAEGSESGSLTAFQSGGAEVTVHVIARGTGKNPIDQVRKNRSDGANRIEDLVNSYVKNRMYQ